MTTIVASSGPERKPSLWDSLAQSVEWVIPFGLIAVIIVGMALVLTSQV